MPVVYPTRSQKFQEKRHKSHLSKLFLSLLMGRGLYRFLWSEPQLCVDFMSRRVEGVKACGILRMINAPYLIIKTGAVDDIADDAITTGHHIALGGVADW